MVTPLGIGRELTWQRLRTGETAGRQLTADEIDHHPQLCELLNRVPGGAPVDHAAVAAKLLSADHEFFDVHATTPFRQDVVNNLQMLSVVEALEHAMLPLRQLISDRTACVIGSSKPSLRAMESWSQAVAEDRSLDNDTFRNACTPDAALRSILAMTDAGGPADCPVAACATGLISVLIAADNVRSGSCDVCIAGSADASLRSSVVASFHRLGVTSRSAEPSTACRPFDVNRDGFIIGEGAAAFVLESRQHAESRGASIVGQIEAGGWLTDPTGITQIDSSGSVVSRLLQPVAAKGNCETPNAIESESPIPARNKALSNCSPPDLCCLHGTATRTNDLAEARGMKNVFGSRVPCFGIKGAVGHLLGAAGSIELAATLLALRDQTLPATVNLRRVDPECGITANNQSTAIIANRGLKLSLGFGGHVAACLVSRD